MEKEMNIFEFIGLPATHRKPNKVTQLVKHFDEVIAKHKTGKRLATQVKKDGVCAITIVHKDVIRIFSRTGKEFTNTGFLRSFIRSAKVSTGVYFGEITCNEVSLEVLSGVVNPNRTKTLTLENAAIPSQLTMNFFDFIHLDDFIRGVCHKPYESRWWDLFDRVNSNAMHVKVLDYKPVLKEEDINKDLAKEVSKGGEGIVIINLDAGWEAGHKGWRKMKKVRGCDYDLRCIDYEEGTGKYAGKVANLIFKWKGGKTIKCMLGRGWTHQMAEDMFKVLNFAENIGMNQHIHKDTPIGKIFQVYALEESSKGKLRLPKVGEQRFDKDTSDV